MPIPTVNSRGDTITSWSSVAIFGYACPNASLFSACLGSTQLASTLFQSSLVVGTPTYGGSNGLLGFEATANAAGGTKPTEIYWWDVWYFCVQDVTCGSSISQNGPVKVKPGTQFFLPCTVTKSVPVCQAQFSPVLTCWNAARTSSITPTQTNALHSDTVNPYYSFTLPSGTATGPVIYSCEMTYTVSTPPYYFPPAVTEYYSHTLKQKT